MPIHNLPATTKGTILGIDPGTVIMGYSILQYNGKQLIAKELGVLKLGSYKNIYDRLGLIYTTTNKLITQYNPDCLAIEAPFFGKNVQSMLKLGRAQGAAIAAAIAHKLSVQEYAPKSIKQAITGNGNASKEQVWQLLGKLCTLNKKIDYLDASDALAAAVCHYYSLQNPLAAALKGKKTDWNSFIANNPERIKKA
jgi:crossover junction endodeoxyribonuclease RuvC